MPSLPNEPVAYVVLLQVILVVVLVKSMASHISCKQESSMHQNLLTSRDLFGQASSRYGSKVPKSKSATEVDIVSRETQTGV
jgi:hypothetical protein